MEAELLDMGYGQEKRVHLYPALDPYFIAVSAKGTEFIREMLQQYYVLLELAEDKSKIKAVFQENDLHMQ